jgi:choline dehydrogenase-like flavoprotein
VVAKELAERGRDVVLLEEGRWFGRAQFNRRPAEMMNAMYRDAGFTLALGRVGVPLPLGRTVGGTTTINSGTCFRVPDWVLQEWHEVHGLTGITKEMLDPYYTKVEAAIGVTEVPEALLGGSARIVRRGAEALGYHGAPLRRNAPTCVGSGVCCFGCPVDAKRSMNVSYVPEALRLGARLVSGAKAEEIVMDGGRAAGVLARREAVGDARREGGGTMRIRADAVVVACGSILTPPFLMGQGFGRRAHGLGRHLTIHPACKVAALMDEEVRGWEGVPQSWSIDTFHREGVMFEGAFTPPEFFAVGFPMLGDKFTEIMEAFPRFAAFGFLIEDRGTGRVLRGPGGRPLVRYALGEPELEKMRKGSEVLARVFFAAGARKVYLPIHGFDELKSEAELERLRALRLTPEMFEVSAFHPLGTARIGLTPQRGFVDPQLESWELDGLYVVDGSVLPTSLVVNPQLTIMAFATRAADHIHARLAGSARLRPAP